jgi:glycosyltransferase involved in cell wall biosynthesis
MVAALVPGTPITIVPNGVEIDNAQPWTGSGSDQLHVVTIGAIGYRKGQFDIVKAAAELADTRVRFVLAGPPETADIDRDIHALVDSLGVADKVEFVGPVGREEKWRRLAAADVFLLPSYGENMPNGILEAMAASLPIITSPVGAVPEMLEDGQGALFVACGDVEGLAAAVRRLAGDAKLRARMAARNRSDCEARFAFERIAEQFDRLYRRSGSDVPEHAGIARVAGVIDSIR